MYVLIPWVFLGWILYVIFSLSFAPHTGEFKTFLTLTDSLELNMIVSEFQSISVGSVDDDSIMEIKEKLEEWASNNQEYDISTYLSMLEEYIILVEEQSYLMGIMHSYDMISEKHRIILEEGS